MKYGFEFASHLRFNDNLLIAILYTNIPQKNELYVLLV